MYTYIGLTLEHILESIQENVMVGRLGTMHHTGTGGDQIRLTARSLKRVIGYCKSLGGARN